MIATKLVKCHQRSFSTLMRQSPRKHTDEDWELLQGATDSLSFLGFNLAEGDHCSDVGPESPPAQQSEKDEQILLNIIQSPVALGLTHLRLQDPGWGYLC